MGLLVRRLLIRRLLIGPRSVGLLSPIRSRLVSFFLTAVRVAVIAAGIRRRSAVARHRRAPAVPVADAIALVAPPAACVLAALHVEHEVALPGQRRVVRLLPAERQDVAAQVAGEVSDDLLPLPLVHPDALEAARREPAVTVVGLDLHGAERRAPQTEREVGLHLLRRRCAVLA